VREFANLAGVRDTWQKSDPRWLESCAQAAALTFWPWEKLLEAGVFGLEPLMAIGSVLLARDAERDLKTIKESYRFTFKDVRIVCFDGLHTSDIAETLGEEADLIVGWHYACDADGPKVIFSCRSRGSRITALDFAKAHGGGGHTHAAGFTAPVSKENSSLLLVPYACVEALVGKYLIEKTA